MTNTAMQTILATAVSVEWKKVDIWEPVGESEGAAVGAAVGESEGAAVGAGVGTKVASTMSGVTEGACVWPRERGARVGDEDSDGAVVAETLDEQPLLMVRV